MSFFIFLVLSRFLGGGLMWDKYRRVVIKVGSALLVDGASGTVHAKWLASLIEDVARLAKLGVEVVIVSSGAVALGCQMLQYRRKHLTLDKKQACAAVGQIYLTHHYQSLLQQHNLVAAQVLLSLDDSENRKRYLNARNTLTTLLQTNVIPIVNENDTVATAEIRYGDNDRLGARVAQMIEADLLVLLSDIDGFYTADPNIDTNAQLIKDIEQLTPDLLAMAQESHSNVGSGGMKTKLAAAQIAMSSGCDMLITAGRHLSPLTHYQQHQVGSLFQAHESKMKAKKAWLSHHMQPKGSITIDKGAVNALLQGKSLLAVGISQVSGHFSKGDALDIIDYNGQVIARGLTNYCDDEIKKIKGQSTKMMMPILGYAGMDEVIHCDNLSLLRKVL